MVELFGSEYVIEHCVLAFNDSITEKVFRDYVSDALMCLSESVANSLGGSYMQKRFADIMNGVQEEDEESADEIALRVIERAGLSVKVD